MGKNTYALNVGDQLVLSATYKVQFDFGRFAVIEDQGAVPDCWPCRRTEKCEILMNLPNEASDFLKGSHLYSTHILGCNMLFLLGVHKLYTWEK